MLIFLCKEDMLVFIKKDGFEHGTYNDFNKMDPLSSTLEKKGS